MVPETGLEPASALFYAEAGIGFTIDNKALRQFLTDSVPVQNRTLPHKHTYQLRTEGRPGTLGAAFLSARPPVFHLAQPRRYNAL